MRTSKIGRCLALASSIVAVFAMVLPGTSVAAKKGPKGPKPSVSTGRVLHVRGTSAALSGQVNTRGLATSYYFQYGPTTAYGAQTPPVAIAAGIIIPVKVVQSVAGLQPGIIYHYRLVAVYSSPTPVNGHDRTFAPKGSALKFAVPKHLTALAGVPFILKGALAGSGGGGHAVVLQASPYPYLEAFTNIGAPGVTNPAGLFSFRVVNLSRSTQFRLVTPDLRQIYSTVVNVSLALNVTLHVRSSHGGLVRLYGTVTPTTPGTRVLIQLQKAVRPGKSRKSAEAESRYVSVFTTKTKSAGARFSRFSTVMKVRHTGRYRAYVKIRSGALVSGASPSVALRKG